MKKLLSVSACVSLMCLSMACSQTDKQRADAEAREAREKADRAGERAKDEAKKLGDQIKEGTRKMGDQIDRAVNKGTASSKDAGENASTRMDEAGDKMGRATRKANAGLSHAAFITKVKTQLANEVGTATLTGVHVDEDHGVVTLTGSVHTAAQKEGAEQAAGQVDGVSKVINRLEVQR